MDEGFLVVGEDLIFAPKRLLTVRGIDFDITNGDALFAICLSLLALEDPRVDAIFRAMNVTFEGEGGNKIDFKSGGTNG